MTTTEEFLCVRCARHMRTCCQTAEVYVSPGDRERIESHTGRDDFWEFRVASAAHLDQDDDPVYRDQVFRRDGSRRVLRKNTNGCGFLGEAGCTLPLEVRPLTCRLYPFDYTEAGIREELSEGCPLELLAPGQGLLEALEMDISDARRWRAQLYAEIRDEDHGEEGVAP